MTNMEATTTSHLKPGATLALGVGDFPIVNAVEVSPARALVLVWRERDDTYITWEVYVDPPTKFNDAYWGHYDMTFLQAVEDFRQRCEQRGVTLR